jgi:hypothetical protein
MKDLLVSAHTEVESQFSIPSYILTVAGTELARTFSAKADRSNAAALVAELRSYNCVVETREGIHKGNVFSPTNAVELFPITQ